MINDIIKGLLLKNRFGNRTKKSSRFSTKFWTFDFEYL